MEKEMFSPMAIDALGEMMNISLGSSATAVSNMLDHRVDITTPTVSVVDVKDFSLGNLEPAIGVEIRYVEGLEGSNIMLLKRSDIKVIVDILMGMETADEDFELNELTISCVCEVMNQMMGSAATAMSDFLGFRVDISTPQSFELDNLDHFKKEHMPPGADQVVVVRFFLRIENALESEFMNVMSVSLAKELLKSLGLENEVSSGASGGAPHPEETPEPEPSNRTMSQEDVERLLAGMGGAPKPAPAPAPEPSGGDRNMSQEDIERLLAGMSGAPEPAPAPAPEPSGGDRNMSQEDIEKMLAAMNSEPAPQPAPQPKPAPQAPAAQAAPAQAPAAQMPPQGMPGPQMGQPGQMPPYPYPPMPGADGQMQGGYMGYPPMYYPPYPYPYPPQPEKPQKAPPEPKVIATKPVHMEEMDPMERLGKEQAQNLDLIMEVPLQVTVEIGRARRKVQDILEFAKGSLVVLDKLAGDQVDLFVNGKCIARGEVVVIEDNFGVRITEIVQTPGIEMLATGR